jgi:hypothetical protein
MHGTIDTPFSKVENYTFIISLKVVTFVRF